MAKSRWSKIILLPLFVFTTQAFAEFQSVFIATVTAEAVMPSDVIPPSITHIPLTNASAITQIAIIQGTTQDNDKLLSVDLFFKKTPDVEHSTMSAATGFTDTFNFSFEVPKASVTTEGLQYRIAVKDVTGNMAFAPSATTYYNVTVSGTNSASFGASGGNLSLSDGNPNDGNTSIFVPAGALSGAVTITLEEVPPANAPASAKFTITSFPVAAYNFGPDGLLFSVPVTITLLYKDLDQDGFLDGTSPPQPETSANIFFWDGDEWIAVGGTVDTAANTITANIMHFTMFGVFPSPPLAPKDLRPAQKIITPNGDGRNDIAIFGSLSLNTTIEIFDVTGRRVRSLTGINIWDGRDSNGNLVESGPYIYQYKERGELVSGVVVVAK